MRTFIRILLGCVGALAGYGIVYLLDHFSLLTALPGNLVLLIYVGLAFVGFIIFFAAAAKWVPKMAAGMEGFSERLSKVSFSEIIVVTLGLIIGLIIATIISRPLLQLRVANFGNTIGVILSVIVYIFFGALGATVARKKSREAIDLGKSLTKKREDGGKKRSSNPVAGKIKKDGKSSSTEKIPKILDTSVIIDGRIFEVMNLGFLEGPFVVSRYVLEELQHISDSEDSLRRERGRRGLDKIQELKKKAGSHVLVDNQKINRAKEVDAKLIILTKKYGGELVTTDYNLNKVASVQSIPVLNVNDLANALKPVAIPGDRMEVQVIKAGKGKGQGLGYLEDGTMIVVENGYDYIGQEVETVVTSQLQTSAGKMIFVKIPN